MAHSAWFDVDWTRYAHEVEIGPRQRISYVDIGKKSGPVVLFVHGLGGSWQAWLENIPAIAAKHRVVALDLPGFGQTKPFTGALTPADYSRVVNKFCQAIGLTEVIAVGNSFGGWISAELTLHNPELVKGLVLIDAAGIPPTRAERMKVVTLLRLTNRAAPLGIKYRHHVINNMRVRNRSLAFMFHKPALLSKEIVGHLLPEVASPIFRDVLLGSVSAWSYALCERVAELDTPALVIWGEQDAQLPMRHGEKWHRLLKNSTLVRIPDAGHLPMIEAPEQVNAALSTFIGSLSKTRARTA